MTDTSEKTDTKTTVVISAASNEDQEAQRSKPVSFASKYLLHLPWANALELLGVIVTITGASILVALLDKQELWPTSLPLGSVRGREVNMVLITPQVILSLTHSIIAFLIGLAVKDGITMAWWRRTLVGGTVKRLDRDYKFGTSLKEALLSGKNVNIIAIATIGAAIAALSQGPLMQRSLTVYLDEAHKNVTVSVQVVSALPQGFTGISTGVSQHSMVTDLLTPDFARVMKNFTSNTPPEPSFGGCNGTCKTTIRVAGFVFDCSDSTTPYTYHSDEAPSIFSVAFTDIIGDMAPDYNETSAYFTGIKMEIIYAQLGDGTVNTSANGNSEVVCPGTMTKTTCNLQPATMEYPLIVDISKGTVTIDPDFDPMKYKPSSYLNVTVSSYNPTGGMTLGGMTLALNDTFKADFQMGPFHGERHPALTIQMTGTLPMSYLNLSNSNLATFGDSCNVSFSNPTVDLVKAVNDIAFRTAIAASNATTPYDSSDLDSPEVQPVNRYRANWPYLAASLAVTILGVAMIVPAFYGWWQLGRKVSLNPIEMAEAFNAPVLQAGDIIHKDADHLLELVGDRKVKYVPVEIEVPGQEGSTVKKMEIVNMDGDGHPEIASSSRPAHWVGGWSK